MTQCGHTPAAVTVPRSTSAGQVVFMVKQEMHDGTRGNGHNRKPRGAKADRALRNRRGRRRAAQRIRSA